MQDPKTIVLTFLNCMGGVSSFNRNIVNFSEKKPGYRVRVILLEDEQDTRQKFTDEINADEVIHFPFSYWENNRSMYRRLSGVIGSEPGCVVTDNWLTLNVLKHAGTPKSIVLLLHDMYYVGLAHQFGSLVDSCIAHSSFFKDVLLATDIEIFQDKVFYIPYGVELPRKELTKSRSDGRLRLVFLGRWVASKGVLLLKQIDLALKTAKINAEWTILGAGPSEPELKQQWENSDNVQFITAKDTAEVYQILEKQDILVFPSKFEGTPVAIMEAMSRGVVPIVTDLPGGTRDMVTNDTGFRCQSGNVQEFAAAISGLDADRELLYKMQNNGLEKGRSQYDIRLAANNYVSFFRKMADGSSRHEKAKKWKLNGLDSPFLPTRLVYAIRKMKMKSKVR
ncbi:MAG TPA: glycosyltransferase family 4 protein [Puia sp.]|nr:glycosyltransferase family 4 protein [Puia sp.]